MNLFLHFLPCCISEIRVHQWLAFLPFSYRNVQILDNTCLISRQVSNFDSVLSV
jgi:hypothetical protein